MNEKVIDYKRYLVAFFLTILYIVCGGLIIYIIIKLNQKTADYIEILNEVAKLIMALITVVLILLFKGFFGKFNWKSYLKGLFIYMLPLTLFDIYHIVTSVKWVFFEHFERYTEHFASNFIMLSCICITTAVTEEIIFRCGIFNYLRRENNKMSKKKAIAACIYSSILFGMTHFQNTSFGTEGFVIEGLMIVAVVSMFGYAYTVLYMKTKNILCVMAIHFLDDFAIVCRNAMSKEKYRFGGIDNFAYQQIGMAVIMVIIATIILYRSREEELSLNEKS